MIKIQFDVKAEKTKFYMEFQKKSIDAIRISTGNIRKGGRETYMSISDYDKCTTVNSDIPVALFNFKNGKIWLYKNVYFYEDENLNRDDFALLANDILHKRNKKLEKGRALSENVPCNIVKRNHISDDVKIFVWKRDEGKCVKCGSGADLEFDHIIPISMGGSNSARNLQLLCASCNRAKGGNLV